MLLAQLHSFFGLSLLFTVFQTWEIAYRAFVRESGKKNTNKQTNENGESEMWEGRESVRESEWLRSENGEEKKTCTDLHVKSAINLIRFDWYQAF